MFVCCQGAAGASWLHSLLTGAKELQEEGEDVDDVHVDVEGTEDVLLRAQRIPAVPHQHLRVKCQELGKGRRCAEKIRKDAAWTRGCFSLKKSPKC